MNKYKKDVIATILAIIIMALVAPFLIYLFIGFIDWLSGDPLNIIHGNADNFL